MFHPLLIKGRRQRYFLWFGQSVSVSHTVILAKLFCYGIHGANAHWIESYWAPRKQKVKIILQNYQEKFSSHWGTIKCGVPQGSIWGHLLFILYIKDLPLGINTFSKPILIADDTIVLIIAKNLEDLQMRSASVLSHRSKWCVVKGLSLNVDKTNVIRFNLNYFQDPLPVFFINTQKLKKHKY